MKTQFENISIRKSELNICARFIRRGDQALALRILYGMLLHDNRRAKINDIYRIALFIRNALASELDDPKCTTDSAAALVRFLVQEIQSENFDSCSNAELNDLGIAFDINSEF